MGQLRWFNPLRSWGKGDSKDGFAITEQGPVNITIYDAVGQAVEVLVNDFVPAGAYKIHWNASSFASGVYFYRMEAGQFVQTQKMILLK